MSPWTLLEHSWEHWTVRDVTKGGAEGNMSPWTLLDHSWEHWTVRDVTKGGAEGNMSPWTLLDHSWEHWTVRDVTKGGAEGNMSPWTLLDHSWEHWTVRDVTKGGAEGMHIAHPSLGVLGPLWTESGPSRAEGPESQKSCSSNNRNTHKKQKMSAEAWQKSTSGQGGALVNIRARLTVRGPSDYQGSSDNQRPSEPPELL